MADVDEDQPINNNNFSQHDAADIDLSDEAQDFRFLSTVSRYAPPAVAYKGGGGRII